MANLKLSKVLKSKGYWAGKIHVTAPIILVLSWMATSGLNPSFGQKNDFSPAVRWKLSSKFVDRGVHSDTKGALTANYSSRKGTGMRSIIWQVGQIGSGQPKPGGVDTGHIDHLEMSGKFTSAIIHYGVNASHQLVLQRELVFPMLRTIPNNTGGSLSLTYNQAMLAGATENGEPLDLTADQFRFDGILSVTSHTAAGLRLTAQIFPSTDKAAYIETYTLTNTTGKAIRFNLPAAMRDSSKRTNNPDCDYMTDARKGVYGAYIINRSYDQPKGIEQTIAAGQRLQFSLIINARRADRDPYNYAAAYELAKRQRMVREISQNLILETPNDTINTMFAFAKLRAAESIFDTKGGLMHGPGGGAYYAAIWANDQAEYVSPFFPFLGYEEGNGSAVNCYEQFARYMNPEYKPLPSSIIAEGIDVWQGAGDRGDQAMIAYGASRFALAYADRATAERLWPLIKWCFTYLERQKTTEGVIASNSDELEGRFPAGKVNLSTNCLAYAGYLDAAKLASLLGDNDLATGYRAKAQALRGAIDRYFGHEVAGFNTYRYYEGNTQLRSWICLPLVVGLDERKNATIKALLSPLLWSKQGILTQSGSTTYWDRATLYAFRGLFDAGATDTCYKYFNYYSKIRLLGEHVPYAVEAWPEGDQRHLAAESGLYCRVVTEGLFNIQPMSFNSFSVNPRLPKGWNKMALRHIMAFGHDFDIEVKRQANNKLDVKVSSYGKELFNGQTDGASTQGLLVQLGE